jgi:hypothetical protein
LSRRFPRDDADPHQPPRVRTNWSPTGHLLLSFESCQSVRREPKRLQPHATVGLRVKREVASALARSMGRELPSTRLGTRRTSERASVTLDRCRAWLRRSRSRRLRAGETGAAGLGRSAHRPLRSCGATRLRLPTVDTVDEAHGGRDSLGSQRRSSALERRRCSAGDDAEHGTSDRDTCHLPIRR